MLQTQVPFKLRPPSARSTGDQPHETRVLHEFAILSFPTYLRLPEINGTARYPHKSERQTHSHIRFTLSAFQPRSRTEKDSSERVKQKINPVIGVSRTKVLGGPRFRFGLGVRMIKAAGAGPGSAGVCCSGTSASPGPAAPGGRAGRSRGQARGRASEGECEQEGQVCEGSVRAGKEEWACLRRCAACTCAGTCLPQRPV